MARSLRWRARLGGVYHANIVVVAVTLTLLLLTSACASSPRLVELPSASCEAQPGEFGQTIQFDSKGVGFGPWIRLFRE